MQTNCNFSIIFKSDTSDMQWSTQRNTRNYERLMLHFTSYLFFVDKTWNGLQNIF
jgi:hypothetical protein